MYNKSQRQNKITKIQIKKLSGWKMYNINLLVKEILFIKFKQDNISD